MVAACSSVRGAVAGQDAKNEPSAEITIGGTGRPVVGRVVLPEGKVLAKGLRGTAIGSELTKALGR
jgi:hypothetical protein